MTTPSVPLRGRYLFTSMLDAGSPAPIWVASDQRTGSKVVAASVDPVRARDLRPAVGVVHDHLATILEIVDDAAPASIPPGTPAGAPIVVAEHVVGRTLHDALGTAPLAPADAVALVLALARAAAALHAVGAVHGAISPHSVVIAPTDGRGGPVLTHLIAQPRGPYCAPERLQGRGWSAADDTWALHVLLFAALTGKPAFPGRTKNELIVNIAGRHAQKLSELGVFDAALQTLIEAGLIANFANRRSGADSLVGALEAWHPPPGSAPRQPPAPVPARDEPEAFGDAPNPFDDEDDATAILQRDALPDARSLLASRSEPPPAAGLAAPAVAEAGASTGADAIASTGAVASPSSGAVASPATAPAAGAFTASPAQPMPATPLALGSPDHSGWQGTEPPLAAVQLEPASSKLPWILGVAILCAGAVVVGLLVTRGKPTELARTAASPPASSSAEGPGPASVSAVAAPSAPPAVGSSPSEVSGVPPTASASAAPAQRSTKPSTPEERSRCIAEHFEAGTFKGGEDMTFLCDASDFRGINSILYRRLVVAGAGKVTPGMREWSNLGWFELAVTAVVRAECCPADTPAPNLPKLAGPCPDLATVLVDLGKRPVAESEAKARAERYDEAVTCLFKNGIPRPYNYVARPTGQARRAFQSFLTRAAARDGQ